MFRLYVVESIIPVYIAFMNEKISHSLLHCRHTGTTCIIYGGILLRFFIGLRFFLRFDLRMRMS